VLAQVAQLRGDTAEVAAAAERAWRGIQGRAPASREWEVGMLAINARATLWKHQGLTELTEGVLGRVGPQVGYHHPRVVALRGLDLALRGVAKQRVRDLAAALAAAEAEGADPLVAGAKELATRLVSLAGSPDSCEKASRAYLEALYGPMRPTEPPKP
jgi:hypothetical protein